MPVSSGTADLSGSERYLRDTVGPFSRLCSGPNQKKAFNGGCRRSGLWDQNNSRAVTSSLQEGSEVTRHRANVLGHKDTALPGREAENFEISFSSKLCESGGLEIHRRLAAQAAGYDVMCRAGVREEPNHHSRRLIIPPRASRKRSRRDSGTGWVASNFDQARSASWMQASTSAGWPR